MLGPTLVIPDGFQLCDLLTSFPVTDPSGPSNPSVEERFRVSGERLIALGAPDRVTSGGHRAVGTVMLSCVSYPARPRLETLPAFVGRSRRQITGALLQQLVRVVTTEYVAGRSLREVSELTRRSFSEVTKRLDEAGVRRRPSGARAILDAARPSS